jgi:hypothetical protein
MSMYLPANPYISSFDYVLQFDLTDGTIKIDLSPSVIIDASGLQVKIAITKPDQSIADLGVVFDAGNINQIYSYALPKVQGVFMWGMYQVKATLLISNLAEFTLVKKFNLCAPDSKNPYSNDMTGTIILSVDCAFGTLMARGFCGSAYKQQPPIAEEYSLTRYYPPEAEMLPQKNLTVIPFVVDAYIGVNTVKGVNISTYDFGDNVFVHIRVVATATKNVRCGLDMDSIYCGMKALLDSLASCNATKEQYNNAFGEINALLWTVTTGTNENKDVEPYIERLEQLLGVECNCLACAGERVGPSCVPLCPQPTNVSALVDTTVDPPALKVSFTADRIQIPLVNVQYRLYCDPAGNPQWIDLGNQEITQATTILAIPIDDPSTYQVKVTSVMADGSHCEPVIIVAPGNCAQAVDINQPPTTPQFTAVIGWSDTPFTPQVLPSFSFQKVQQVIKGQDIPADYSDAPANTQYLIVRYPNTEQQKTIWFNTNLNNGTIPDQVFEATYSDANFLYAWTRITPTLDSTNKTIVFKK